MAEFEDLKNILKHIDSFCWDCEINDKDVFDIAKNLFKQLCKGKTSNKKIFRLIGQSGCGKTSQLLPASRFCFKEKNLNPIHFCVRKFALFHPNFENLLNTYGLEEIREKTNGFALRLLLFCLVFAIEQGYDLILEVTLLTPKFEKFLTDLLLHFRYDITYLSLAVNKKNSDNFIEKRKQKDGGEQKRKVYKSSAIFFYKNLNRSIRFIAKKYPGLRIIVWNAFDKNPQYDGSFGDCLKVFFKNQKDVRYDFVDPKILRDAKQNYLAGSGKIISG